MLKRIMAFALAIALLGATFAGVSAATAAEGQQPATAKEGCTYFAATQHNLCAGFQAYWNKYGGLGTFGMPITEEYVENGVTTQYFERARFEWRKGSWPARFDVELGLIGDEYVAMNKLGSNPAFSPVDNCPAGTTSANCVLFSATGHSLSNGFLAYWKHFGALAIFGMPISQEFVENGVTVQYFERARFEWRKGSWPARWDVELGLLGDAVLAGQSNNGGTQPPPPPTTNLATIATGLNVPYGMTTLADGSLLVGEAGTAGQNCVGFPSSEAGKTVPTCFGNTGAIAQVDPATGKITTKVSGLPSFAAQSDQPEVIGVAGVASNDGQNIYFVTGLGANPSARDQAPADFGSRLGHLFMADANGKVTDVADISAVEAKSNPAKGPVDTNPYAVLDLGNKRIVADAGGNDLIEVDADGTTKVLTTFSDLTVNIPADLQSKFGGQTTIKEEPVPDALALGPDGAYYVGFLTGGPFIPGAASVVRVDPKTGDQTTYASGFSNIISVAFAPDGTLYVLEIAKNGMLDIQDGGALYQVAPDGTKTEVASNGLIMPTSVVVAPDGSVYVTNMALIPGKGEIDKVTVPATKLAMSTVASGLNTVYGMQQLSDGQLLVAEAGVGGDTCANLPSSEAQGKSVKTCFGNSGSIVEVDPSTGDITTKAKNLPSMSTQNGDSSETIGATSASSADGQTIYYVTGLGNNPDARSQFPNGFQDKFGHLFKVDANGNSTDVVDVSAYEKANNPAKGPVDSNPYAVVDLGNGTQIIADAGGNDLLQVDANGKISVITTFNDITVDVPADMQAEAGGAKTITEEPVPDSVTVGPDGAYYVGLLTGGPFIPGAASVIRVDPKTGDQTTYASGFSNIISVAFGPDGSLFVLELAKNGSLDIGGGGALYQVAPNGAKSLVTSDGLVMPTSVVVAPNGDLYLTTMALVPGKGQIVKISR